MTETKNNGKLIAIITMCFIFAMISFVQTWVHPLATFGDLNIHLQRHGVI